MFQGWKSRVRQPTFADQFEATRRLVALALAHLRRSPKSWPTFIDLLPDLPRDELSHCLELLGQTDLETITADVRLSTWQALAKLIAAHRRSPTAPGRFPMRRFAGSSRSRLHGNPRTPQSATPGSSNGTPISRGLYMSDYIAYERKLAEARQGAVASVLRSSGDEGLTRLIKEAPVPGFVGVAVAETERGKATGTMLARLAALGLSARQRMDGSHA